MTEERKQELRRLLEEAMGSLEIRYDHAKGYIYEYSLILSEREYRMYLYELWSAYSPEPYWFYRSVAPHIVSETTKTRFAGFIREELVPFIERNLICFDSYFIDGNHADGFSLSSFRSRGQSLDDCLNHLLKIAIVLGVEEALEVFERCSHKVGSQSHYQYIASLEGIRLGTDIQICDRVRLITVPDSNTRILPWKLIPSLSDMLMKMEDDSLRGKTLLMIDRPIFSIFSKLSRAASLEETQISDLPFQLELNGERFTNSTVVRSFAELFCQALSLACDSAIQISGESSLMEEGKFFHPGNGGARLGGRPLPSQDAVKVGESQTHEAMRLHRILEARPDLRERLQIPIDRWIMSKTWKRDIDKMIDLGIALEALYVSEPHPEGKGKDWQIRHHASAYLKTDSWQQETLKKEFQEIYRWRSVAVHKGRLPRKKISKTKKIPYTPEEMAVFIQRAQKLCRDSILQIIDEEKFPDWLNLEAGGDS